MILRKLTFEAAGINASALKDLFNERRLASSLEPERSDNEKVGCVKMPSLLLLKLQGRRCGCPESFN